MINFDDPESFGVVDYGPDVFTVREFADANKLPMILAQRKISDMVTVGKAEHVGNVAQRDLNGVVRCYVAAYRLTDKGKQCMQT